MHIKTVASADTESFIPVDCFDREGVVGFKNKSRVIGVLRAGWRIWCRYTRDNLMYAVVTAASVLVVLIVLRILDWLF